MPTQEKDQMCDNLVQKMTTGNSLDEAEKTHLAKCEVCMAQLVRTLDESTDREAHGLGMAAGGTNGDLAHARPEAKKAREHGGKVFEREFGITFSKD